MKKNLTSIEENLDAIGLGEILAAINAIHNNLSKHILCYNAMSNALKDIVEKYVFADENISALKGTVAEVNDDITNKITDGIGQKVRDLLCIEQICSKYRYIDNYGVERVDTSKMTEDEKKELIDAYERLNPDYKNNMDSCLEMLANDGYDQEILDIKVIAYTAPEPYRSTYLQNVGELKVVSTNYDPNRPEHCAGKELYLNVNNWRNFADQDRKYSNFFHECAHGLDNILGENGKSYTETYNNGALDEALQKDLKVEINKNLEPLLSQYNLTPFEETIIKAEITSEIMQCPDYGRYSASMTDLTVGSNTILSANDMQFLYDTTVKNAQNEVCASASDIFGGYTGNTIAHYNGGQLVNAHPVYKYNNDGTIRGYWREGSGTSEETVNWGDYNHQQVKEAWAENYAAQMMGDMYDADAINEFMPNGRDTMEEMMIALQ